jgi:hypothetical protein
MMAESRKTRGAVRVAHIGEKKNACKVLVEKSQGKKFL